MSSVPSIDSLSELTRRVLDAATGQDRFLVALAGPPGAGKSYRSQQLFQAIDEALPGQVVVVPMDGYHFDNAVLGDAQLPVKGAPHTFDADGLRVDLKRIRRAGATVAVPVFDRPLDLARAGGRLVTREHRIVIVEGNYLLLDQEPWRALHDLFDLRVMLEVDDEVLERRLIERWWSMGHDDEFARRKALDKDMPNAHLVKTTSIMPDLAWR
ncbi:nucleoside/nucleotide kinase family protein [Halomonas sp. TRM85114]|uniref:nucleoside/nucleotide kinase family protein n=1 Tax=Halomonas jincaotanensis TaxID=2810616 RepID=UPI001BD1C8BE|nr:nucleoside/nucleotide kinase family protein [Halomonas jincaotanensis]MBS9404510.1 nucleoside/nucleotide kinase family protein [Halomonas jincaotanensis]